MKSYGQVAREVAEEKARNPERFCGAKKCLWRTQEDFCPRHQYFATPSLVPQLEASIEQVRKLKESA